VWVGVKAVVRVREETPELGDGSSVADTMSKLDTHPIRISLAEQEHADRKCELASQKPRQLLLGVLRLPDLEERKAVEILVSLPVRAEPMLNKAAAQDRFSIQGKPHRLVQQGGIEATG